MHLAVPVEVELKKTGAKTNKWHIHNRKTSQQSSLNKGEKDHFTQRDGIEFAGTHLLLDLCGANHLDDIERIERAMRDIVTACGATLLHIHLHHFSSSGGVSGVAVLAESHISVHTWPERNFAAFDVFMCGDAQPENALPVLKRAFYPHQIKVSTELRGVI